MSRTLTLLNSAIEIAELNMLYNSFSDYVKTLSMRTSKRLWIDRVTDFCNSLLKEESVSCIMVVPKFDESTLHTALRNEMVEARKLSIEMFHSSCVGALERYNLKDRVTRNTLLSLLKASVELTCSNLQACYVQNRRV